VELTDKKITRVVYSSHLASSMVLCHLNNIKSLKFDNIKMVMDRNSTIFMDP